MQNNPPDSRIRDFLVLLYVLGHARSHHRKNIQNTLFLIEKELEQKGLNGPRFSFVRYMTGPFSSDLSEALDRFGARGFIDRDEMMLTQRGTFLADLVLPEFRNVAENPRIFDNIDRTLVQPQSHATVGSMLSSIPLGQTLIAPSRDDLRLPENLERMFRQEFELTDAEIETAKKEWPDIEARALARLRAAMSGDPQDR